MVDSEAVQETEIVAVEEEVTSGQAVQEKCTKQHALTVDRRQKFHSSQQKTDQFTAENASRNTDQRDTEIII
jgi:hypothetical protein